VDLLSAGPERPPGPESRRWVTRGRRLWRHRGTRAAAVVLVAALALVLLRATVDPQPRIRAAAPATASPSPAGPMAPFDRLPGRTPIPVPAQTRDGLSGPLPVLGGPDRATSVRAVQLVLGRFCAEPQRYVLTLQPDTNGRADDFHHLDVLVTDRELTDSGPAMRLTLDWDGRAYRWLGPLTLLRGC
jgi:hypothetical protein